MRTFLIAAVVFTFCPPPPARSRARPWSPNRCDLRPRRRRGAAGQHRVSRWPGAEAGDHFRSRRALARGNRADASSIKVTQWAEFGFFAMSIDYRLVGGSPAPAPYLDMLTAIRWVHAHAEEYRIDPERVYLIGQSAGGQMVSLFATAGEAGFPRVGGWEKARTDVRAVISVAATYELNTLSWGNLWTPVSGNVEDARRLASPVTSCQRHDEAVAGHSFRRRQVGAGSAGQRHGRQSSRPAACSTVTCITPTKGTWASPMT